MIGLFLLVKLRFVCLLVCLFVYIECVFFVVLLCFFFQEKKHENRGVICCSLFPPLLTFSPTSITITLLHITILIIFLDRKRRT